MKSEKRDGIESTFIAWPPGACGQRGRFDRGAGRRNGGPASASSRDASEGARTTTGGRGPHGERRDA